MNKVFTKAQEIGDEVKSGVSEFDPTIIVVLAGVIVELVKAFKECKGDDPVENKLRLGRKLFDLKMKRVVRRHLKNHKLSTEQYEEVVLKELNKQLTTLSDAQVKELAEEV